MFTTYIYEPIFNALLWVHHAIPNHDMGLAIILVTLVVRLILYIPSLSSIKSSRSLQTLQPKLRALQEKYKDNKEMLAQEQMKLYREHRVNPLSSCLPLIIQLPILIGLYRVFFNGLHVDSHGILVADQLKHVYGSLRDFYAHTPLNTMMFGWVDLAKPHNIILAVLAGAAQFWQTKMLAAPKEPNIPEARDEALTSTMNKQMTYIFPLVTLYLSYRLPAGLGLYWAVSTTFTIIQQYIFLKSHPLNTSSKTIDTAALPAAKN